MEQGLSYSPAAAAEETQALLGRAMGRAPVKGHVAGTGRKPTANHEGSKAIGAVESGIHHATQKITAEDRVINGLHTVREAGNSLWMLGWVSLPFFPIPLPIPSIVGKLAGKVGLKSVETAVNMAIEGATKTVRGTALNQWHAAPGALLKNASTIAEEAGKTAAASGKTVWIGGMAKPLSDAAKTVDGWMGNVASSVSKATEAPRAAIGRGVDAFGESGVGQGISKRLESVFEWRKTAHAAKLDKRLGAATAAFTLEPQGFFRGLINKVTGKTAPSVAIPTELAGVMSHVNAASALSGVERTARLGQAMEALTGIAKDAPKELAGHAAAVQGKIAAALKSSTKVVNYGAALEGGISVAIKNGFRSMGNAKLLTAAIAVGAVAGTVATFMSSNKENKQAAQALADMKAAVGNTNPELIQLASQKATKRARTSMLGAVVSGASEFMSIGVASGHAAGNVIAAQMGMGMAAGQVVSENPILNAYTMLDMHAKGKAQIELKDRVELTREIIGAKKSVAQHGGKYNQLAGAMAQDFQSRNVPVAEIFRILGNETEFTAFSKEIFAKQQAAVKPVVVAGKAAAANEAHVGREPVKAVAQEIVVAKSPEAANAPSMKLAAGPKMHHGTVAANQLQVG